MNKIANQKPLRLYLIRHGEVEGAEAGRLLGRTDAPLSERGREQSHQLAQFLSRERLTSVYSSDLLRARTMADTIATRSNLEVRESSAWREINMGEWEGRTFAALHGETPKLVAQLFNDPAGFVYPHGESFAAFTARVRGALDELLKIHESGNIALITHGGVCRVIIGDALGMLARNWLRLAQDYGCVNVVDWYDGNPTVKLLNGVRTCGNSEADLFVRR
jgi:alpha-ribazole phosphatase/probable phosphoglycerate mutase